MALCTEELSHPSPSPDPRVGPPSLVILCSLARSRRRISGKLSSGHFILGSCHAGIDEGSRCLQGRWSPSGRSGETLQTPWSSTQGPVTGRSFFPYPVCYGVRTSLGSKKSKGGASRPPPPPPREHCVSPTAAWVWRGPKASDSEPPELYKIGKVWRCSSNSQGEMEKLVILPSPTSSVTQGVKDMTRSSWGVTAEATVTRELQCWCLRKQRLLGNSGI